MKLIIESSIKARHEYTGIFWLGVLVFILSNAYFGWNKTAQSGAERVWDVIWFSLVFVGGIAAIVRSLIEEYHQDIKYNAFLDRKSSVKEINEIKL